MDVAQLIERAGTRARKELKTPVKVIEVDDFPAPGDIYSNSRTWLRIDDVVALVADLKGSTRLDPQACRNQRAHLRGDHRLRNRDR